MILLHDITPVLVWVWVVREADSKSRQPVALAVCEEKLVLVFAGEWKHHLSFSVLLGLTMEKPFGETQIEQISSLKLEKG